MLPLLRRSAPSSLPLQAGTPRVDISTAYDADALTFQLTCKQSCPATPGQPEKQPFLIPIKLGLIGSESSARLPAPTI